MRSILAFAMILGFVGAAQAGATPDNPSGYGGIVQFGAQEDHDLYPGPGNVIGDVRSGIATTSDEKGLAPFVESVRESAGSTPNPPPH
jgi:hypothetical protein